MVQNKIEKEFVAFKKSCVIVPRQEGDLVEQLARLEHEQWSHWIKYQEKKFGHVTDMTVDEWYKQQEMWQRWIRLAQTPYGKLTEKEKESDREWANKVLAVIQQSRVIVPQKKLEDKAFTIKVWVADSPEKPIPKLKGAIKQNGHFEEKQAILLDLLFGVEKTK